MCKTLRQKQAVNLNIAKGSYEKTINLIFHNFWLSFKNAPVNIIFKYYYNIPLCTIVLKMRIIILFLLTLKSPF